MARAYHEHPIFKVSSVGRPVDARYPSNKAVLLLMLVALLGGIGWGWFGGLGLVSTLLRGLTLAGTVFGSWALGRELDPDRNATAFIAAAFAVGAVVLFGTADLWTLMLAIPLTRIVSRTVGPAAKTSDLLAVLGLVALAVFVDGRWSLGVAAIVALALDGSLPRGQNNRWGYAAAGLAIVAGFHVYRGIEVSVPEPLYLVLGVVVLTAIALATMPKTESLCDLPDHTLVPIRVTAGVALALVLFMVAQLETDGLAAAGVGAALLALLPGRLLVRYWPRELYKAKG